MSDIPRADITHLWHQNRWHYQRSLASRVIIVTTVMVGLVAALLAGAAYATVSTTMQRAMDADLRDRAEALAADFEAGGPVDPLYELPRFARGDSDQRVLFVSATGQVRSWDDLPALPIDVPEFAVAEGNATSSMRTIGEGTAAPYRVVAVAAGDGRAVIVAQSLRAQDEVLDTLAQVMLIFAALSIVTAALTGWAVARNGLRPVRRLTTAVEEIARTEDLRPLVVEGDDEIARLAGAFNKMLVSLAASRDRQKRLVGDASHELRTPLTSLRTNLDLLAQADVQGGLDPAARDELLDDVRAQLEELTALVGDLVELARDEPLPAVITTVDLAEVIDRALIRVRRRATPDIEFVVSIAPWWVNGEANSLERAVTNLLDNAVKWSPEGGRVTVTLSEGVLVVEDEGPGISAADLPKVFDRFYRANESRTMPGSGLGLSIVRQVAERHGGTAEAGRAESGGARLILTLPGDGEFGDDDSRAADAEAAVEPQGSRMSRTYGRAARWVTSGSTPTVPADAEETSSAR